VTFTGRVSDERVAELLRSARALVVTAAEEFGIAAVEAQASGRPVVALAEGGVQESVLPGRTGTFYAPSDPDALAAAVAGFDALAIDPAECVASARRFTRERFQHGLARVVDEALAGDRAPRPPQRPAAAGLVLEARRPRRVAAG
jgi:glycosyltransferase involved in cell wall biosynthesis